MRRYVATVIVALLTVSTPSAASPEAKGEATSPEYDRALAAAVAAHRDGRWAEAYAALTQAHAIAPSARTYRALGMTAFELGNYLESYRALSAALSDERRPLTEAQRAEVDALRTRAAAHLGRFVLERAPAECVVFVDGRPTELEANASLLVVEGTHEVLVTATGFKPFSTRLTVNGGTESRLVVALEPAQPEHPPPVVSTAVKHDGSARARVADTPKAPPIPRVPSSSHSSRTWTWVAAGATGVFGVTALSLGIAGQLEYDRLQDQCREGCVRGDPARDPDLSTLRFFERSTNVALTLTGVSAATAVTLFFLEGASTEDRHVRVSSGKDRLIVSGRF